MNLHVLTVAVCWCVACVQAEEKFYIEGKVSVNVRAERVDDDDIQQTKIIVDDGRHIGIPRADGRFRINNLPAGSYVVEASHPKYSFEPIRVDINSQGKRRARRLNRLQPSVVRSLPYPLRLTARTKNKYFAQRNTWTMSDVWSNPMIMWAMLLLPLFGLTLLLQSNLSRLLDAEKQDTDADIKRNPCVQLGDGLPFHMPSLNDLPIPDLSELVMRALGDWTDDNDGEKTSTKTTTRQNRQRHSRRVEHTHEPGRNNTMKKRNSSRR